MQLNISEQLNKELQSFRDALKIQQPGTLEKLIKKDIIEILQTEPILALKDRYQLGLVYKVLNNTSAKHTRLDHTIGVVAKCIIVADLINGNTNDDALKLTETDVRELAVAAALHDCGHLPVSHATERAFLTAKGLRRGISHEERIVPLIINRNPYFEKLQNIVLSWKGFNENSFYRIASIISSEAGEGFERANPQFKMPKRAIQQLLVSEIDMDRLDYVVRDANQLNYYPVKLIQDKIIDYVKGLSLIKYKSLNQIGVDDNVELCLKEECKDNVFSFLVCRVLLYKYVYFSKAVRSFEAILTYLVGTFIDKHVALEPLKLIAMSDDHFINEYLNELVPYVDSNEEYRRDLVEKYINVLKAEKVERFKHLLSIHDEDIENPRLKEEFIKNIHNRYYIDNLKKYLQQATKGHDFFIENGDILIDVFHLKTGGGGLMVVEKDGSFRTLSNYMNGSNMHRLCSEIRLDIYMKSDIGERKNNFIKEEIETFFKNI